VEFAGEEEMHFKRSLSLIVRLFLVVVALGFAVAGPSRAQNENGSISGTVVDAQQKAVPNATVTATDLMKQVTSTAKTDAQGLYTFPELAPGTYTFDVEAPGFKKYSQENVVVHVNDKHRFPTSFSLLVPSVKL
jgi:hypothetical protein